MKVTCNGCGAEHWLPDMHVANGACRTRCPNCSTELMFDATMRDPSATTPQWHYLSASGEQNGPVSSQNIEELYMNGQITMDSLVWCNGMPDWATLSAVPELEYLRSFLNAENAGEDEETRIGGAPAPFTAAAAFGGGGEETAAIDLSEFQSTYGQGESGIVGMGGGAPEDDFSFDMGSQQSPAPAAGSGFNNANDMVGAQGGESSVLFSLSSLQAVGPAPAAASSGLQTSNDGMIDVKALADSNSSGKKRKTFEADPFDNSVGMVNRQNIEFGNKKDNTGLYIGVGVVAVLLVGIIVTLIVLFSGDKKDNGPQQAIDTQAAALQANAGGTGVESEVALKAKEEADKKAAEAEAKKAEEAAAAKKAEEEAAAKKAEEEAAAAKKAEEEAAAKKAEEEAAAAKKADTKKADTKTAAATKTATTTAPAKKDTTTAKKTADTKTAAPAAPAGGATLTKEQVQSVIRSSFANVRTCSRTSATKGTMKVSFTIKADGKVSGAKCVSPEFAGSPAATCVVKVVNGLKFPASSKDTPVTYPFQIQ